MITKECIRKCVADGITHLKGTKVIGVDTTSSSATITLLGKYQDLSPVIEKVWECSHEVCLRDLPDFVESEQVELVMVDIGPERLFAEQLKEAIGCEVLLANYTSKPSEPPKSGILNVNRNETLRSTFRAVQKKQVTISKDYLDSFPPDWEDQMTSFAREWFRDTENYVSVGQDNCFHSLTYALLAADQIKQKQLC